MVCTASSYLYHWMTLQEIDFQSKDEFLLLACDGLWDVLDSQDAVDIVSESLKKGLSAQVCREVVKALMPSL